MYKKKYRSQGRLSKEQIVKRLSSDSKKSLSKWGYQLLVLSMYTKLLKITEYDLPNSTDLYADKVALEREISGKIVL